MRLYIVEAPVSNAFRYAGTMADARQARMELMEVTSEKKLSITITEVEVKTSKPELLATLNSLATKSDPQG